MNTVAMRCILHGSVSGFLKYVEETIADVRYHQHFPLRKAHAAAKSGSSKMFNSLFLLQRSPEQGASFSPLLWSVGGESAVEYPVCVEAEPIDGGLIWRVACQAQLFSRGETETLINQLEQVLKFILERETAEVLSFHGEDVSICGMPAVAIREAAPIQGSPEATLGLQDEADNWRETDSAIRDAVCHVLGVPPESIKPWSNLHQLGLDSISAIKVSVLLRKRRVHLKPRELVDSPSLEDMARSARLGHETEEQLSRTDSQWMPPRDIDAGSLLAEHGLGQDAVEAILPASPMQAYMLTAWQNSCGSLFFPEFRFRVEGPVDTLQARKAWLALLGKMPILRTRFIATGSKEVPWIQMIAKEDAVHSGLVSQPLVNFRVVEGASGEGLTIRLRIHHALYDGFSLPALMRRLGDLLIGDWGSKSNGILHWARHCIGLPMARVERREFWTKYLRGGAPISVPPTLSEETKGTTTSYLDVSAINDVAPLRAVALRHAISLQSLVLAALATSIGGQDACSGEKAVVLGIYLASRAEGQDSPLAVYPTLNLVPLKVQLGRGCSAITLARGIQEDIHSMGIAGRADVGLWEILAWTGMKIDCFINFLAEPPVEAASADPEPVTLTPIREEVGEGDAADGELSASTSRAAWEEPWLQKNSIRDAIQLSVDIEAAVHGQGLALGVFGPHGRVSNEWAAKLVADTAAFLGDVAG
ncbi:hypothetical protein CDD83_8882 [Cordyceps sp. RAO-2017]|nr:hypothetical protein CDD83_8882 [Cordyceps sp. RAO-2017]